MWLLKKKLYISAKIGSGFWTISSKAEKHTFFISAGVAEREGLPKLYLFVFLSLIIKIGIDTSNK